MSSSYRTRLAQVEKSKRVLIIASHTSYRTAPFVQAALSNNADVVIASESKHSLSSPFAAGLHIPLDDIKHARQILLAEAERQAFSGVIGTDDATSELAALVAHDLQLPHSLPRAVRIARRKDLARFRLAESSVRVPNFRRIDLRQSLSPQIEHVEFPCVLKPVALSASRGVIRANDANELLAACARVQHILKAEAPGNETNYLLIEDFIPGNEVAVEAILSKGELQVLAIFDKPDPLDGPYFEESYYISPARLPEATKNLLIKTISDACDAYGLTEGPVHAECRINHEGVWVLEVAARTIGGMCSQLFEFGVGHSLEQVVLAHALGEPIVPCQPQGGAGVLMIPITQAGILRRVEGVMAAQQVPYIEDVVIARREGYELIPLPEGSSYLGFMFARAPSADLAEKALRQAHACLDIVVAPLWNAVVKT